MRIRKNEQRSIANSYEDTGNKALKPKEKIIDVFDDAKDIAEKAGTFAGDAAKLAGDFAGVQLKQAKNVFEKVKIGFDDEMAKKKLEKYGPIFSEDTKTLAYPKMINVIDFDKQMDVAEFRGAVGYKRKINNAEVLGIFQDDVQKFENIEFIPDKNPSLSVYYVHPLNDRQYIEITEYFTFLKEQRIAELEYIAQELGAKHFKVQIMEESFSSKKAKYQASAKLGFKKDNAGVKIEKEEDEKKYEFIGIAAENTYPGKEPNRPELKLWAGNESIKSLVEQRLSDTNPLQSKTFRLDYNTSSGIKEKKAAKIDGVLKALKFGVDGSVMKEVQKENKRKLEYTIEF